MSISVRTLIVTLMVTLVATSVAAQGRGNAFGRGRAKPAKPTAGTNSATLPALEPISTDSSAALRQFGAWLDDASVLGPGHGWVSVSAGHSRSLGARQFDFPVIEAGMALNRRAQFGGTILYYRMNFSDGTGVAGFGDVYLNLKYALVDPEQNRSKVGLAVAPLVEVLSAPDPVSGARWSWAIPVSVEIRQTRLSCVRLSGIFCARRPLQQWSRRSTSFQSSRRHRRPDPDAVAQSEPCRRCPCSGQESP